MKPLRIGTRGSALALAQANWVKNEIERQRPGTVVSLEIIKTSGDRFVEASLQAIGGKGVFTKEIEEALLGGEIEIAVHSMKDLPTELTPGLAILAVPEREDPRDVLVSCGGARLMELPAGARIGTGSLRRKAQVLSCRPDLVVTAIRGNIDTRLNKLDAGEVEALVVAAAGLIRIGREDRISEFLSGDICVSAVAQGALAIEGRDDEVTREELAFLHDVPTALEVQAERALLRRLGGGCYVPVGARAQVYGELMEINAIVADPNGSPLCKAELAGMAEKAEALGKELADRLLGQGAQQILASLGRKSGET
ncbi:MAG TPA: hydroxymethylbilane synthase [Candidatus Binatia bacterium]|nr:hydroxymethylbilane synthase [Candidatus Binatia bacterium]